MEEKELKLGGLLLSALITTPDQELGKLRRQRLGRDCEIDLAHLLRLREILHQLVAAIQEDDPSRWERVHAAWKVLHETRRDDTRVVTEEGAVGPREPPAAEPSPTHEPATAALDTPAMSPTRGQPAEERAWGDSWTSEPSPVPPAPLPLALEPEMRVPVRIESRLATGTLDAPVGRAATPTLPFAADGARPAAASPVVGFGEDPATQATLAASRARPAAGAGLTCAAPTASLSLAGYAALCAVCQVAPEAAALSQTVYGVVGEHARATLDAAWQERFAATPALRDLFAALCGQFSGWLRRHGHG